MKTVARLVLLLAAVMLVSPSLLLAQQETAAPVQPLPVPELRGSNWNQLGANPLIPDSFLPAHCRTKDPEIRWQCTKSIILEEKGYEKASSLFYLGAAQVFFLNSKPVPAWFKQELQERARFDRVDTTQRFRKGYTFYPCGMAFGFENKDGIWEVRFHGNPTIQFSEPEELVVFMLDPIDMREEKDSPYGGHTLAAVIPMDCVNLTCMQAEKAVAPMPTTTAIREDIPRLAEEELEEDKDDMVVAAPVVGTPWYKRKSVMIPLIAAGAAVGICAAVCRGGGEETIVVREPVKGGAPSPGGSPASTAPAGSSISIRFSFGI